MEVWKSIFHGIWVHIWMGIWLSFYQLAYQFDISSKRNAFFFFFLSFCFNVMNVCVYVWVWWERTFQKMRVCYEVFTDNYQIDKEFNWVEYILEWDSICWRVFN